MPADLDGKRVLLVGGTGSLGSTLVRRLLSGSEGSPSKITVYSRDEAKQHALRMRYSGAPSGSTDEVIYGNAGRALAFRIGDVRDPVALTTALRDADVVFHAAALKQVPSCEYAPAEAVATNVVGADNLVRAIANNDLGVEAVVGVSTDKAVEPVNVMGMTKALQERVLAAGNLLAPRTRFVLVRYGNVLASRGSVIPLFHQQIRDGGPLTVTDGAMTRFLLSLEEAVDLILDAHRDAHRAEIFVPRIPAARILDVASALAEDRDIEIKITGVRPGEKLHERLISDEEGHRTVEAGGRLVITPILPELCTPAREEPVLGRHYSSDDDLLDRDGVRDLLDRNGLLQIQEPTHAEILR